MILSDLQITEEIVNRSIIIKPYDSNYLGSNSYDVHLSKHFATYGRQFSSHTYINNEHEDRLGNVYPHEGDDDSYKTHPLILDVREPNPVTHFEIPEEGYVLLPGNLYLASTIEYTETHKHVPCLEGKSSLARLGMQVHCTAGFGDCGYCGHWVLEIIVTLPVRIYPGMPIAQIYYHQTGKVGHKYNRKRDAKYNNTDIKPKESLMFKNYENGKWK